MKAPRPIKTKPVLKPIANSIRLEKRFYSKHRKKGLTHEEAMEKLKHEFVRTR